MTSIRPWLFASLALFAIAARAASVAKNLSDIYAPFRVQHAALSPDGAHVAFAVRERGRLELQIYSVTPPRLRARTPLDARATAELAFLGWSSGSRVVAATDSPAIVAVDADGTAAQVLVEPRTFAGDAGRRAAVRVRGFSSDAPDLLAVEVSAMASAEDVTLALWHVNVRTGERKQQLATEVNPPGGALLVDRQGVPRLLFSRGVLPQSWRHRAPDARGPAWRDLDAMLPDRTQFAFGVLPRNFLGERTIPLGFDFDPDVLYFASNLGRDTFGVYAVNLRTSRRTSLAVEDPEFDLAALDGAWENSPLVFDRARRTLAGVRRNALDLRTHWLDPEIGGVEARLEAKFPGRDVQLLEWDEARECFLVLIGTLGDPGRYFVFHASDGRCVEFRRRAPELAAEELNRTEAFAFEAAGDARVSGYLTTPRRAAVARPPLIVWLHDGPGQRTAPGFQRDAQALATMGFMVAQVDYRGSSGYGRARRETLRIAPDTGPLDDVRETIGWLAARHAFDPRRVALIGEGFGGYLALRALQRDAEAFRCAVAFNAPLDLGDLRRLEADTERFRREMEHDMSRRLFNPRQVAAADPESEAGGDGGGDPASDAQLARIMAAPAEPIDFQHELNRWFFAGPDLAGRSVRRDAAALSRPVFLLHEPGHRYAPFAAVRELRDTLERRKGTVLLTELPPNFAAAPGNVRAAVMRRVGEFLNVTLYDFDVKVGEAKEAR